MFAAYIFGAAANPHTIIYCMQHINIYSISRTYIKVYFEYYP